jgi:hypothetical protein
MGMLARWVPKRRRGKVAALLALLVAVAVIGAGIGVALNYLPKQPQVIYVVYDSGPEATVVPSGGPAATSPDSPRPSASSALTLEPGASAIESASLVPTPGPTSTPAPVVTPRPTASPKPDLVVVLPSAMQLGCNDEMVLTARARNDGTVATPRATTIRLTDMYLGHATVSVSHTIPILAPGQAYVGWVDITVSTGCNDTHTMLFEVDPDDLIAETSESNNVGHMSYTVTGKPDLRTYGMTLSPAQQLCDEEFTASITVHNTGTVASGPGLVRFVDTYGGTALYSPMVSLPAIVAGGHVAVHVHFNVAGHMLRPCASTHRITAYIDPDDDIDEVYETNNTWSKDYVLYAHL